jgi:polygalacturonase
MKLLFGLALACLAHSSLAAQPAPLAGTSVCDVRQFGAVGDSKHLDSPAIQQAIESTAKAGGGTVWVPPGTYLCGSMHLLSNIHLLLDAGAIILAAPQSLDAYDPTEAWNTIAYEDGGHVYFHNSLIWGENLTNVSITGQGKIEGGRNGEGLVSNDGILDHMCGYFLWHKPGASLPDAKPVRLGNKAIALKLCRNVLLRDMTIYHGGHFAILVTGCDDLTVDNVTMDTDRDGIDIDCCRNAMVSNCRINSPGDDGLCLKSTYALNRTVLTENITIVNCQVSGFAEGTLLDGTMKPSKLKTGRIKFGTESSGGFRNCTVSNCTFRSCRGLALEEVDGGIMENITIDNLAMQDVFAYAIYVTTGQRNRTPNLATPSRMRNISISNVTASGVDSMSGIQVTGLAEQPIEDIRLSNIRLDCDGGGSKADAERVVPELGLAYPEPGTIGRLSAYGIFARNVRGLQLTGVTISSQAPEQRPALRCETVDGLDILDFKAPLVPGVPVAKFIGVENLTISAAPVLAGTADH